MEGEEAQSIFNATLRKRTIEDVDDDFSKDDDEEEGSDIHSRSSVEGMNDEGYYFVTSAGNRIEGCIINDA